MIKSKVLSIKSSNWSTKKTVLVALTILVGITTINKIMTIITTEGETLDPRTPLTTKEITSKTTMEAKITHLTTVAKANIITKINSLRTLNKIRVCLPFQCLTRMLWWRSSSQAVWSQHQMEMLHPWTWMHSLIKLLKCSQKMDKCFNRWHLLNHLNKTMNDTRHINTWWMQKFNFC